jgi:hypothetical protein
MLGRRWRVASTSARNWSPETLALARVGTASSVAGCAWEVAVARIHAVEASQQHAVNVRKIVFL